VEKSDSEIYERAAQLIEEHGHVKGEYGAPTEGFCLAGALIWASEDVGSRSRACALNVRLSATLMRRVGMTGIDWNDRPERTAAEVVAFLREFTVMP
jgi:hypothetical protein